MQNEITDLYKASSSKTRFRPSYTQLGLAVHSDTSAINHEPALIIQQVWPIAGRLIAPPQPSTHQRTGLYENKDYNFLVVALINFKATSFVIIQCNAKKTIITEL